MSTKADYSPEQWQLLLDVPPAVGTAVMHAERSGIGTIKETFAMYNSIMRVDGDYKHNELIQSLLKARLKDGDKSEIETLNSPYAGKQGKEILEDTLQRCQSAATLLQSEATSDEAAEYADWVISIAERVAEAAAEGGFLGIGGQRVSEAESNVISAVTKALKARL